MLKVAEAALADAAHEQQMFRAAEGAVALAVFDDAGGEPRADSGQVLEFLA